MLSGYVFLAESSLDVSIWVANTGDMFKKLFESKDFVVALTLIAGHSTQNGVALAHMLDAQGVAE